MCNNYLERITQVFLVSDLEVENLLANASSSCDVVVEGLKGRSHSAMAKSHRKKIISNECLNARFRILVRGKQTVIFF